MRPTRRLFGTLALAAGLLLGAGEAQAKDSFKIAWSIYVGWMPWGWAADQGIVKKWADKYGITIDVVQINDYVESINQYTAGGFDGCVMTNMDALTIPAVGGVDSTALIVGDFSNGNDGIVSKTAKSVADLSGQSINLVELSVSHYLLARALEQSGLAEKDVTVVNTSDADIVSVFSGTEDVKNVVTWNPLLSEVAKFPGATELFNSSQIPGEIIDLMVVNTKTLAESPAFGKALVGAWYETMSIMRGTGEAAIAARTAMAEASGTDLAGFDAQLASTRMFWDANEAVEFTASPKLVDTMQSVRTFSNSKGLMGGDMDAVGIGFPGGKTLGAAGSVKLRFDESYMKLAAEGGLSTAMTRLMNRRPGREGRVFLAALPFALVILAYLVASAARLAINPEDKLLPWPSSFIEAMRGMAFEPDKRSGDYLFWVDTGASLLRLLSGLAIAAAFGLVLGIAIGLIPYVGVALTPFVAVISMVPCLAVLPILFIVLGLGETAKITLITLGTAPYLVRDIAFRVHELPEELLIKAQTLGGSTWQIVLRVVLPQVLPRLLSGLRLSLGPAWLFLIAAEAIASTEGLGYRVFLVRRFLAMDVILPYVAWITLLAFVMDRLLDLASRRLFRWTARP